MGRPGLTQNRKFRRLSLTLGGDAIARGHLELMWDSAYESGDEVLGDGIDVELAAGWRGEGGVLVTAMVKTGFLDVLPAEDGEVFVIHDFWHHAPAYVRKRKTREDERRSKVDPCRPIDQSVTSQSLDTDEKTAPLPHPHPHPQDKDKKSTSPAAPSPSGKRSEVISIWNETTDGKLAKAKVTTKRFGIIAARMAEPGWLDDFKAACAYLVVTPFYLGQNDRGWTADLDWVLKPGKATELAEKAAAPKNGVGRGPVVQFRAQEAQDSFIAQLAASGMEDF